MNKVNTTIHVVSKGQENTYPSSYKYKEHGINFSTSDKIRVNKVLPAGYSVVMDDTDFLKVNNGKFAASLIKLLRANVPNTIFDISVEIHIHDDEDPLDMGVLIEKVLDMDALIHNAAATGRIHELMYHEGQSISHYRNELLDDEEDSDDDDDEEYDDEEEEDENDVYPFSFLKGEKRKKKSKEYYGRSRVWRNAKNPKRDINRHGVIIASDKDDIERDAKVVKDFLKDFLPGDASWKKEFRKELAKRWMKVYAISKKKLKGYEKDFRNQTKKKRLNTGISTGLNIMNRMVNRPIDSWSDPSK